MKKALISVCNKEGLAEFAKSLVSLDYEIISTGGTYKLLKGEGIKNLKKVEEITGFPEIMDGRVKTLHPKIFGGILADRSKEDHLNQAEDNKIPIIDLVVCNLYQFDKEPGIENIDIGGVTLLRAAAKNYQDVTVVSDVEDYNMILEALSEVEDKKIERLKDLRKELAYKAFCHTADYDAMIADYLSGGKNLSLNYKKLYKLRYGENPHQKAALFEEQGAGNKGQGIINAEVLHGKELSYNNILDADGALNLIREFDEPAAAVIKHTNPCGCAVADNITQAFKKAYAADSLSAFGGIIILNRECTKEIAEEINKVFAEIVIASDYEAEALNILKQKKNIRILKINNPLSIIKNQKDYKKVVGGILEQDYNNHQLSQKDLKIVTKEKPSENQLKDLLFAWKVVKHVKSNAIVLVKGGATVGIGAGQMSRVDAVDMAIKKAAENIKGCAVASDAFFPFRDSIDKLAQNEIKSIVQPGGSIKDEEVIAAADELKMAMVFTKIRAFKH